MYRKMMFRFLVLLATLIVTAGCGTAQATATQAPVITEVTQRPADPTTTTVPPTEKPVEASPTAGLPTPTPVITEIAATSTDQFLGRWRWFVLGSAAFITFKPDGTWEMTVNGTAPGTPPAKGVFSFDGNIFTINGDPECPGVTGKYEAPQIVQYDGVNHTLSFKVIEDACEPRVKDFKKGFAWSESQAQ